jgi:hypothetical protein
MIARFDGKMVRLRDKMLSKRFFASKLIEVVRKLSDADAKSLPRFCNRALAMLGKFT